MPIQNNTFESIRQVFVKILSVNEPTATVSSVELVLCLVFQFYGQAKDYFGPESFRMALFNQTGISLKRSSFSERLGTNKLNNLLSELLSQLTLRLFHLPIRGSSLCKRLGVKDILLLDSSSSLLPDGANALFPGISTEAALKYHLCLSLLSGYFPWTDFSEGTSPDSTHFPDFAFLKNKLLLHDLGYYEYLRFHQIDKAGGFYFSRSKLGCALKIVQIKAGLPLSCLGKKLSELEGKKYFKKALDLLVEGEQNGEVFRFRVVGFYNRREQKYHFYLTNLQVEVSKLRKLYQLRWQIELFFKSLKQSLGMEKYKTTKLKILVNLVLASGIAQVLGIYLFQEGVRAQKTEEEKLGISFQRVFGSLNILANSFKEYILSVFERNPPLTFEEKASRFLSELSDPDKNRKNSLQLFASLIL